MNILPMEKQILVANALAEGSSIRSIERITGIHRDTIMRLGVRIGNSCITLMDKTMRDLPCKYLQLDEIWGFIGKKEKNVMFWDNKDYGDVWTFIAVDEESRAIPCFRVGRRTIETASAFIGDLSSRLANRVQVSTDSLRAYAETFPVAGYKPCPAL